MIREVVILFLALLTMWGTVPAASDEIRAAVAANFADAMSELVPAFEAASGHTVVPVFGSTGKHYAQIANGAPFDIFLAADAERPRRLEAEGLAVAGSRFTYAVGRLALWSREDELVDAGGEVLGKGTFHRLAIANPELAPYGRAAEETLRALGLWERLEPRLVRGENISQTFQFVQTGNAELGLVALSQVQRPDRPDGGSCWIVPRELHQPIEQQAVLLRQSAAAREFLSFLAGEQALKIIGRYGYAAGPPTEAP